MIDAMTTRRALSAALVLGLLAMLGPAAAQPRPGAAAPELTGGPWINSRPLTLAELRGRVVLVEFWTYG
jgi:ABC-type nitrate/sulfonate/bicarbonate transport system substrate-binding protein